MIGLFTPWGTRATPSGLDKYANDVAEALQDSEIAFVRKSLADEANLMFASEQKRRRVAALRWRLGFPVETKSGFQINHMLVPSPIRLPAVGFNLITVHDLSPLIIPQAYPAHQVEFIRSLYERALKWGYYFVTNSYSTTSDLIEHVGVPNSKIKTIQLGINWRKIRDGVKAHKAKKEDYFIVIGGGHPRKNLRNILIAYESCAANDKSFPDLRLAGCGAAGKMLVENVIKTDKIRAKVAVLGYLSEQALFKELSDARALVYTSIHEGFGYPILEAFASLTNVLTSNNSSMLEVGGTHASYADPHSTCSIAQGLRQVRKKPKLGVEVDDWLERFAIARFKERNVSFYRKLLTEGVFEGDLC